MILSAIAYNMPGNKAVKFFLDGSECKAATQSSAGVFSSECFSIPQGNYFLEAILYEDGTPVATDTNAKIATQGDYILTIGDNITNGTDDNFISDNRSTNVYPNGLGIVVMAYLWYNNPFTCRFSSMTFCL